MPATKRARKKKSNVGGPRPNSGRKRMWNSLTRNQAYSLPTKLVDKIAAEAGKREVSASALVAEIMAESLGLDIRKKAVAKRKA